jgi:hypothetical protein
MEPVAANMGVVLPQPGFLQKVRALTKELGIVLIFDEVITGFRLSYGGAQAKFNMGATRTSAGSTPPKDRSTRPAPSPATPWPWQPGLPP